MNALAPERPLSAAVPAGGKSTGEIRQMLFWIVTAATAFHLSYLSPTSSLLIILYVFGLVQLSRASTGRKAFYSGLAVGLLIAAVRLGFFWQIFSAGAIALWFVYSFWIGLFTCLA